MCSSFLVPLDGLIDDINDQEDFVAPRLAPVCRVYVGCQSLLSGLAGQGCQLSYECTAFLGTDELR